MAKEIRDANKTLLGLKAEKDAKDQLPKSKSPETKPKTNITEWNKN